MTKSDTQKNKKTISGIIVKLSSENTIKVKVESKHQHPLYGKIVKSHRNFLVHYNGDVKDLNVGDIATIAETKPISKNKAWVVVSIQEQK